MATTEQLTVWLAAAEQAQHDLMLGNRRVTVSSSSGKSVTYTAANAGQLSAYIASLKRQLGLSVGRAVSFRLG